MPKCVAKATSRMDLYPSVLPSKCLPAPALETSVGVKWSSWARHCFRVMHQRTLQVTETVIAVIKLHRPISPLWNPDLLLISAEAGLMSLPVKSLGAPGRYVLEAWAMPHCLNRVCTIEALWKLWLPWGPEQCFSFFTRSCQTRCTVSAVWQKEVLESVWDAADDF